MKIKIIPVIFFGLLLFLFGCQQNEITKTDLIGNWEAEKLNTEPLANHGISSIKLLIKPDSLKIALVMNSIGITMESSGKWELNKGIMMVALGDKHMESDVTIRDDKLIFSRDPLLNSEPIFSVQFAKIN